MGRRLAVELNVAHARNLMQGKPGIFSVGIDNGLAHGWRQRAFILRGNCWRWNWGQQRGHACLVKQIGFGVERTLGDPGFYSTLFGTHPEEHNRSQDLVLDLCWICEHWANL